MSRFSSWLKRNFPAVLLLVLSGVLAASLLQAQQVAQNSREASKESENRFVASHGLLAAALEGDTLSLEKQLLAVQECAVIRRELSDYRQNGTSEEKRANLILYYDSVERYLTETVTSRYSNRPRGEAIALSQKDQSIVNFIRNSSQRVYDALKDLDIADRSMVDDAYSAIGEEFEATFHTFDRNDFFRHDNPLGAFFE